MRFSQAGSAGTDHSESDAYIQWRRFVEYAVKGEKALGGERVLRISYDDLINQSEATLRECFRFLGEEFSSDALLPLQEKINSSKVTQSDIPVEAGTEEGKAANAFYHTILNTLPGNPEAGALKELAQHYENYAAQINVR
jgi:hypothetical protein